MGNQIASQQFTVKLDELAQTFSNVLIMPYGGYRWNLYQGLYVQGWGGAGYTTTVSGATDFADLNYDVAPIIPFGALHLGYEF